MAGPEELLAGHTCLTDMGPLTLVLQLSRDGLWTMILLDREGGFSVVMPSSEYGLAAAQQKALLNAGHYMRKHRGVASWTPQGEIDWKEFAPRTVIWET